MRNSAKTSLIVSRAAVYLLALLLIALAVMIPFFTERYFDRHPERLAEELYVPSLIFLYTAMVPAFAAVIALDRLLAGIGKGELFTDKNVRLLTVLVLCCFGEALIFFGFGFCFMLSFLLSFAALFMGLMLLTVTNLVRVGVDIKHENDYTI